MDIEKLDTVHFKDLEFDLYRNRSTAEGDFASLEILAAGHDGDILGRCNYDPNDGLRDAEGVFAAPPDESYRLFMESDLLRRCAEWERRLIRAEGRTQVMNTDVWLNALGYPESRDK